MKALIYLTVNFTAVAVAVACLAQGSFSNFDFERANIPAIPPSNLVSVPIADGMPGWIGYLGTNQLTSVLHNGLTIGSASISILGPDYFENGIIEGHYTAVLQAGFDGLVGVGFADASLAQVGLVPASARILQLKELGANFSVTFDGQNIPLSAIGSGANYTLYEGDISAFAGQTGELRFSALTTLNQPYSGVSFDSVKFTSVPEPSVISLVAACAAVMALAFWRRPFRLTGGRHAER